MDYHRHIEEQKALRKMEEERKIAMINQAAPTVKPRVSLIVIEVHTGTHKDDS